MNVVFIGNKKWGEHLARLISDEYGGRISTTALPLTIGGLLRLSFLLPRAGVVVRIGFRPGIPKLKAILADAYYYVLSNLFKGTRWAFYWIGTDVFEAIHEFRAKRQTPFASMFRGFTHVVGAPWFVRELAEIGIEAVSAPFPSSPRYVDRPKIEANTGKSLVALTYIPDDRWEFYGGSLLIHLAKRYPAIHFTVIGGSGTWVKEKPDNVTFEGWVEDVGAAMNDATVVIRYVPHDAIGGTVREALAAGCHVIYTYPLPHVRYVRHGDVDGVCRILEEIVEMHARNGFERNIQGQEYARATWGNVRESLEALLACVRK